MMIAIQTEGEGVSVISFEEFAELNESTPELVEEVKSLNDYGQSVTIGGGAAPLYVISFFSPVVG